MNNILQEPSYGWQTEEGELIVPTSAEIIREFFSRMIIFKTKKNWLAFTSWVWALSLAPALVLFILGYFSWWLLPIAFLYSMVFMGCHGTIWYHRYSTHTTFKFSNDFWRFITQNLVIKVISEEGYVISHHVHHAFSDKPGDPYNAQAGWLYCFLADANHQPIALDLDEKEYDKVAKMLSHTGVYINTYKQYQKWGTITHPVKNWVHLILNWAFWYGVFFLIGGHGLALCLFGAAHIWAIGVRTFNYEGHGKGEDKREEGFDFSRNTLSINQYWPGYVAGEWHSNHHLFPNSARNGFTPSQLDLPWLYIRFLYAIGGVSSYRNSTKLFYEQFYEPYQKAKKEKEDKQKMVSA